MVGIQQALKNKITIIPKRNCRHADFVILTLDVYSHVLPNMQKDATEQLEKMIFGVNG
jgi:hypothetical protein